MEFLREIVKSRTSPVLRIQDHVQVEWCIATTVSPRSASRRSKGEWLVRAPRVSVEDHPSVPASLVSWLSASQVADSHTQTLALADNGQVAGGTVPRDSAEAAGVRREFSAWLPQWQAWAASDRIRRPQAELYTVLQLMMQGLAAHPESIELTVASGLLNASSPDPKQSVRTHIVTQRAGGEREEALGDLLVRRTPLSSPRLEDTQFLTGREEFDSSGSLGLQEVLRAHATSPLSDGVLNFLKEWAPRALDQTVDVNDQIEQPAPTTNKLSRLRLP